MSEDNIDRKILIKNTCKSNKINKDKIWYEKLKEDAI